MLYILSVQLFTPVPLQPQPLSTRAPRATSKKDLLSPLHLPRRRHAQELQVKTIQGKPLGHGRVKYEAPSLKLKISNLDEEEIIFPALEGPTVDIILGCPWLILHSPEIKLGSCKVIR